MVAGVFFYIYFLFDSTLESLIYDNLVVPMCIYFIFYSKYSNFFIMFAIIPLDYSLNKPGRHNLTKGVY